MTEAVHKGSWLKTFLGTAAGLLSGAAVMLFTPLLDKVVKPPKPVANFAVEHNGLSVTFHNRSMGGSEGRWDFGDGSPLEFVRADQPTITHTYPKPSRYVATYTVTSLLGEENERSVEIELTEGKPRPPAKPAIVDLYVRPPGKHGQAVFAPATYQFEATADNAIFYVWDFGEGKGVELADHRTAHTYTQPGTYTVTLTVFNANKEKSQHDVTLDVYDPPKGLLNVSLQVADQGTQIETRRRETVASQVVNLIGDNPPSLVEQTFLASAGFQIVSVERSKSQSENLANATWSIAPDGASVKVVGHVASIPGATTAIMNEHLIIIEQRRDKSRRDPIRVANTLPTPGSTSVLLPPPPENWVDVKRDMTFELRDGDDLLWAGQELPQNVPVRIGGRTHTLAASTQGDRLQVQLTDNVASR